MPAEYIYLASASPRRGELLRQIRVAFRILPVAVDESVRGGEAPLDYVARLAAAKAESGWDARPSQDAAVLAADTTVVLQDQIFGKPRDDRDGEAMLLKLSGRTHEVAERLEPGNCEGGRNPPVRRAKTTRRERRRTRLPRPKEARGSATIGTGSLVIGVTSP